MSVGMGVEGPVYTPFIRSKIAETEHPTPRRFAGEPPLILAGRCKRALERPLLA
jgi:hypothetical protein